MPNWNEVLKEINDVRAVAQRAVVDAKRDSQGAQDQVRRKYLKALHEHTGRPLIAYYSGWLSKPQVAGTEINDEDKNGFMMAVHRLDRTRGLDLILHTPGGDIAAAESIVDYLAKMFPEIRVIVPQIAMSAGTMIACAARSIILGKHSNLGPIDPSVRGLSAQRVIDEFSKARREILANPAMAFVWRPILEKYHPTYLGECESVLNWSRGFVEKNLRELMFRDEQDAGRKAATIRDALERFGTDNAHGRHLHIEDCEKIGLRVERLEDDAGFQDLVLTVHHCFMQSLSNTPSFKMIENHLGLAFVKQHIEQMIEVQMPNQMRPAEMAAKPAPST